MKSGAANQKLPRFVRRALILRVFKYADGRELGAVERRRRIGFGYMGGGRGKPGRKKYG
jgi:hypothetical protein